MRFHLALCAALISMPSLIYAEEPCDHCKENCTVCQGCNPDLATCSPACELCFTQCEEDCPYWESTPICNYLDRGINDFMMATEDQYFVFQENVEFLSDLDRLRFGLDLPATHCNANPHGVPCADKDYSTEWRIDSVRLSVAGVPLFFETKPAGAPFLIIARGGFGDEGMGGWDRAQLRSNSNWGLSENEILRWYTTLPLPDAAGNVTDLQPGTSGQLRQVTADELSRLIEGIVGRRLAQRNKRADCEGQIYCDNVDGIRVYWRGALTADTPECDLGGCPAQNLRRPSPWFEVRRGSDGESLVVDIDLDVVQSFPDLADCPFGAPCGPGAHGLNYVGLAEVGVRLVYRPECVEVDGKFIVRLRQTDLELDGGWLDPIVEALAPPSLESELADAATLDLPYEYPSCPSPSALVTVVANGGLNFAAPPQPAGTRWYPADRLVRWARWLSVPPAVEPRTALQNAFGTHVANISFNASWPAGLAATISGPIDLNAKRLFSQLQDAVARSTALGVMCPTLDFADVEIPPPDINPNEAVLCRPFLFGPINTERCRQLGWLKAFALQPAVQQCFIDNGVPPNNPGYAAAYGSLLSLIDSAEGMIESLETVVPVPNITLDIRTGEPAATDGFAFVDLQDPASVTSAQRDTDGCRNRYEEDVVPDPYEYPDCSDPADETNFGELGCPCKDIDGLAEPDDEGGYADGEGSHAEHGVNGGGQYCEDNGLEAVCGVVRQQGKKWPVCFECGVDTKVGCACETDAECQGFEADLICWGSELDGDWPGQNGGGKCLPAPEGEDGREALEEIPWLCLDNCESLGQFQSWNDPGCIYTQTGIGLSHGTCVDLTPSGGCGMPGECEETGMVCRNGACDLECLLSAECPGLGFPGHYVCDGTNHCAPPECGGAGVNFFYCQLFR